MEIWERIGKYVFLHTNQHRHSIREVPEIQNSVGWELGEQYRISTQTFFRKGNTVHEDERGIKFRS